MKDLLFSLLAGEVLLLRGVCVPRSLAPLLRHGVLHRPREQLPGVQGVHHHHPGPGVQLSAQVLTNSNCNHFIINVLR